MDVSFNDKRTDSLPVKGLSSTDISVAVDWSVELITYPWQHVMIHYNDVLITLWGILGYEY